MNKTKIMLLASASFLLIMTGGCESKISSEAGSQIYDEKKQYSNDGDNIIDNHSFEKELDVIDNIFVVDNSELIIKGANKNGVAIIRYCVTDKSYKILEGLDPGNFIVKKQNNNYVLYYENSAIVINSDFEISDSISLDYLEDNHVCFLVYTKESKVIYEKSNYDKNDNWIGDGLYATDYDGKNGEFILMYDTISDINFVGINEMSFDDKEENILYNGMYFESLESGNEGKPSHGIFCMKDKKVTNVAYDDSGFDVKANKLLSYSANKDPRVDKISGEISIFDGEEKIYKTATNEECMNATLSDQANYFLTLNGNKKMVSIYSCKDGELTNQIKVPDNIVSYSYLEDEKVFVCLYSDDELNNKYYEEVLK